MKRYYNTIMKLLIKNNSSSSLGDLETHFQGCLSKQRKRNPNNLRIPFLGGKSIIFCYFPMFFSFRSFSNCIRDFDLHVSLCLRSETLFKAVFLQVAVHSDLRPFICTHCSVGFKERVPALSETGIDDSKLGFLSDGFIFF